MMVSVNRLTKEEHVRVIAALIEGNSVRATVRMTGIVKNTVAKSLYDVGKANERCHEPRGCVLLDDGTVKFICTEDKLRQLRRK